MKQLFNRYIYLLLLIFIISCCKNKQDPCIGSQKTSAEFTFLQEPLVWSTPAHWYNKEGITWETPDTAMPGYVTFSANFNADRYEWRIGQDTTKFSKKAFSLFFDKAYGKIPIRLIVNKTPNKDCFPGDDGIDTVQKILTIVERAELPVIGFYRGFIDNKPDSIFILEVNSKGPQLINCSPPMYTPCPTCPKEADTYFAPYGFEIKGGSCNSPYGFGKLNKEKRELRIEYYQWEPYPDKKKRIFTGKKI